MGDGGLPRGSSEAQIITWMIWEGVYRGDLFSLPEELGEDVLAMLTGRTSHRNRALSDIRMRL